MKRIASLALSAALLASLSTPVLAAPAISVDAAPTAAVLEEENSLWELPQADTPDMSNTVWSFAGGYIDGGEMTQPRWTSLWRHTAVRCSSPLTPQAAQR